MCSILELSGLFVFLGGLVKFFSAWGDIKNCWAVPGAISTQVDTMDREAGVCKAIVDATICH